MGNRVFQEKIEKRSGQNQVRGLSGHNVFLYNVFSFRLTFLKHSVSWLYEISWPSWRTTEEPCQAAGSGEGSHYD